MSKQLKLAISGRAKTGKNTVASMLVEHLTSHNLKGKIVGIADPMKHIVKTIFPEALDKCLFGSSELRSNVISDKYIDKNGAYLTYRQALLDIGAYGRKYNDNVWLNLMVEDANKSNDIGVYIISDVRFVIEFDYLKNTGFIMIRVLRDNIETIDDPSENEQDTIPNTKFDYIIHNNKSIDKLYEQIRVIANKIKMS
jgi:hypothetical protein